MNCRNEVFMKKVGDNKIDKKMEVHFDIQRNLADCKKLAANKYMSVVSANTKFNKYVIPANQFECMRTGCVNSGTLYNEGSKTVYKVPYDSTEWSAGVITFYVIAPAGEAKAVIQLSATDTFADAWKYEVPLASMNTGADGFTAVVVDLAKTPTVIGNGWTPSDLGAYLSIEIVPTDPAEVMTGVAISSISIFDEMADFEISNHVIISCLTGIDGNFDLEAAEASCFGSGYNTDDITGFEKTVTGRAVTPNYMALNPMAKKGTAVKSFDNVIFEKTVAALAGTDYGYVMIADMSQDECGFFSASLADSCNITDAQLVRLSIPSKVDVDEKHYQLIDNGDGTTTVLFNQALIGQSVLISYPKAVDVEETIITEDAIGDSRVRMSYVKCQTDGTRYRYVYNNVLITSFPDALTQGETEFAFTINIQKDASGNIGYRYRILD